MGSPYAVLPPCCARIGLGIFWLLIPLAGKLSTPAYAQCGGVIDCPTSPMPVGLPPSNTELGPPALDIGSAGVACVFPVGAIEGVTGLTVGVISELQMFTDEPAVEILSGSLTPIRIVVPGSVLMCGGVVCVPGLGNAITVTDTTISGIVAGRRIDAALPPSEVPISAAVTGTCAGGSNATTFNLHTFDSATGLDRVHAVLGGFRKAFTFPTPFVVLPDSFTNGPVSGVVGYAATEAHILSGGVITTIAYGGTYIAHAPTFGGVIVTHTGGTTTIPLVVGAVILPFSPCMVPLDSCGIDATASAITMNIAPCPAIGGASATWPAPAATCRGLGGFLKKGKKGGGMAPTIKDKFGLALAFAWTTLGVPDLDVDAQKIWNGGKPGTPGTPALALALSAGGGDISFALAFVSAAYDAVKKALDITAFAFGGNILVHRQGHFGIYFAAAIDPLEFEQWDPNDDLGVELTIAKDTYLPMTDEYAPGATSRLNIQATTDIPGFEKLYVADVSASFDGVSEVLSVQFSSNPLLGLNDPQVESDIAAAFTYNASLGGFEATSETLILDFNVNVPAGKNNVAMGVEAFALGFALQAFDPNDANDPNGPNKPAVPPDFFDTRGGCCLATGGCLDDVPQPVCEAIGGVFAGIGQLCEFAACHLIVPEGACQLDAGNCRTATLGFCDAAGGFYLGDNALCEPLDPNVTPFAEAGPPQEVTDTDDSGAEVVALDGSGSFDPNGTIVDYTWSERGVVLGSGPSPTANVALPVGIHTILLDILDDTGRTARDVVFIKVLPPNVIGRHDFDTNSANAFSQNPPAGTFTSPGDAFEKKQRGVSPAIPFAVLDDTGTANLTECAPFPNDSVGMVMCAKRDAFFAVADLRNPDNPLCDKGRAGFSFDISGASNIQASIDMAASGDFEAPDPCDPNAPLCNPFDFTTSPFDRYDWTWSIDGSPPLPLFTSSVDELATVNNVFFSGRTVVHNDPMIVNGVTLDNIFQTISAPIPATGTTLTLRFRGRGDSNVEAYAFDDILVIGDIGGGCGPACDVPGGDADVNNDCSVNLSDLAVILGNFGQVGVSHEQGDTNNDGFVNLTDLANVLARFGQACP